MKELTRALHIIGYSEVDETYGELANHDPFRHLYFSVMQTNQGLGYKLRAMETHERMIDDYGINAAAAFVQVHAVSFNTPDYWVSSGFAHRLLEGRRIFWNRFNEASFFMSYFMPNYQNRNREYKEQGLFQNTPYSVRGKDYESALPKKYNFDMLTHGYDEKRFPLALGREYVGTLMDTGSAAGHVNLDDRVWGVSPIHGYGTATDFYVTKSYQLARAPKNLTNAEAATLPFSGLLFFNAVETILDEYNTNGRKILVIGAAGKIGHVATQILQAWGAEVSILIHQDESEFMQLNTALPIDSSNFHYVDDPKFKVDGNLLQQIFSDHQFDVILNCSPNENDMYLYSEINSHLVDEGAYITMNNPVFDYSEKSWYALGVGAKF